MITHTSTLAAAPLRLVTGEPVPGFFDALPLWMWVAIGVIVLLMIALVVVLTLGRDRSHRAEAERAFRGMARGTRLSAADRKLLETGARETAVEPVACLLSLGAFDRVAQSAPREFSERFEAFRAALFPEAEPSSVPA